MYVLTSSIKKNFLKTKAQWKVQYIISKRVLSLSQMERWLRYFARDCGCLEKSGNPQRENRLAELPRQTTNREGNGARPSCLPAHTRQGGYESFFREESFEYSILAGKRSKRADSERDGRLRVHGTISFLLFPSFRRVTRKTHL